MSKFYTKCPNCDEIVEETFDESEGNCNLQAMVKSASVHDNCRPKSANMTITKSAAVEEQEEENEESAFITLHKLQFGEIR